jgi:hypothetical protein
MQGKSQSTRMDLMPRQSAILTGISLEASLFPSISTAESHNQILHENKLSDNATTRMVDNALQILKVAQKHH